MENLENRTIEVRLTQSEIIALLERKPIFNNYDISAVQKLTAAHARFAEDNFIEIQAGNNMLIETHMEKPNV